jgi:hypothetical protein
MAFQKRETRLRFDEKPETFHAAEKETAMGEAHGKRSMLVQQFFDDSNDMDDDDGDKTPSSDGGRSPGKSAGVNRTTTKPGHDMHLPGIERHGSNVSTRSARMTMNMYPSGAWKISRLFGTSCEEADRIKKAAMAT